ncbi:MAG: arsinothricin resistance N-acetyltransferase ArsN1 family A [Dehalococcoidia bacterium]
MKTVEQTVAEARAVRMLRALANPVRFRVAQLLAERKECLSNDLADALPVAPSSLFEHLTALREAGLVQDTGEGAGRLYSLEPDALDFLAGVLSGLSQRSRSWLDITHRVRMEDGMIVRDATADDAAAIARIYNQGIEDRVATLETVQRTPEERAEWLLNHDARHPVLIAAEPSGEVAGWASLNPFNPRPAYDHVVDFSIYIAREKRGRGIGDMLLSELETRARAIGFHKIVLAAFPTNAAGMRLYERHGFQTVGIYREQGMLDGRWVDVIVMEKILD